VKPNLQRGVKKLGGTSKYRGVCFSRDPSVWRKPWKAYINTRGYQEQLGHFATEIEAAEAHDKVARERGAPLNFPPPQPILELLALKNKMEK